MWLSFCRECRRLAKLHNGNLCFAVFVAGRCVQGSHTASVLYELDSMHCRYCLPQEYASLEARLPKSEYATDTCSFFSFDR